MWRHTQTPTALPPWSGQTLFCICFAFLFLCIFIFLLFLFIFLFFLLAPLRDGLSAPLPLPPSPPVCSTNQPSRSDKIQYAAIWLASISWFSYDLVIYLIFIFYFIYLLIFCYLICHVLNTGSTHPCAKFRRRTSHRFRGDSKQTLRPFSIIY